MIKLRPKVKVSIVEDDVNFQNWILDELSLSSEIECISQYVRGEDAVSGIIEDSPDLVLMDLELDDSEIDGIECMATLKIQQPALKFLVISSHNDEQKLFKALKVGAGAYIHKDEITRKLVDIILEFYDGGAPMSLGIAEKVIKSFHQPITNLKLLQKLTTRENEILKLIAAGFLDKEIANELKIKEGTVRQHTHRIYQKLQVNNRTEATLRYL